MRAILTAAAVLASTGLAIGALAAGPAERCRPPAPTAALEPAPDQAEAYLNRGTAYADRAQYPLAIADLDRAIGIRPDLVEAYVRRGEARYEIGDYPSAIADFTVAARLDAGARAYLGRANALRDGGQPEEALADYAIAIEQSPRGADAYLQRAIAHHRLDQFDAERADWTTAIRLDHDLYWQFGTIYRHRHLYDELRSDHQTALRHEPDGAKAYFSRAEAHRYRHHDCQAIQDYTAAIDLGYVRAHLGRGIAHVALGAYDEAIADLSRVLERRNTDVEAYFYRGRAYRAQGLVEQARADLTRALRLSPFNPVVRAAIERSPSNVTQPSAQTCSEAGGADGARTLPPSNPATTWRPSTLRPDPG